LFGVHAKGAGLVALERHGTTVLRQITPRGFEVVEGRFSLAAARRAEGSPGASYEELDSGEGSSVSSPLEGFACPIRIAGGAKRPLEQTERPMVMKAKVRRIGEDEDRSLSLPREVKGTDTSDERAAVSLLDPRTPGRGRTAASVLQMQRLIGNRATLRLLQSPSGKQANPAATHRGAEGGSKARLPEGLRAGVEALSGVSLANVTVHANSSKPRTLGAAAYTEGTDIHVAPGQEKHLPHEAWHVVQQHEGRVPATRQLRAAALNDEAGLEREADVMGARAAQVGSAGLGGRPSSREPRAPAQEARPQSHVVQRYIYYKRERMDDHYAIRDRLVDRGFSIKQADDFIELYVNNEFVHKDVTKVAPPARPAPRAQRGMPPSMRPKKPKPIASKPTPQEQKKGKAVDLKRSRKGKPNPNVVEKLPTETETRIGFELEPGSEYAFDAKDVEKDDLDWIDIHWGETITTAYYTPKDGEEFAALELLFDGYPSNPTIESRTTPRKPTELLKKKDIDQILSTMTPSQLGKEKPTVNLEGGTVRWVPNGEWPKRIEKYKPLKDEPIRATLDRWENIHISHTLPIGRFLEQGYDAQTRLIPHLKKSLKGGSRMSGARPFFKHFAKQHESVAEKVGTSSRSRISPNIKTPLDTLFQVYPYGGKEAEGIKKDLESAALKRGVTLQQPQSPDEFVPPTPQSQKDQHHLSVEEKPRKPFFDPHLGDVRVLVEHRPQNEDEFWRAVYNHVVNDKPLPKWLLELFEAFDEDPVK
jgi:hypothetical protein